MKTQLTFLKNKVILVVLVLMVLMALAASPRTTNAQGPVPTVPQPNLPAMVCTGTDPVDCDIWAKTGTLSLPGAITVPIWGYAVDAASPALLPGPVLAVEQGVTVNLTLHNDLGQPTTLSIPGLGIEFDKTEVAVGATMTYSFVVDKPGTFLYEASLFPNGVRQVAMGLFGALIVRPAGQPEWAYSLESQFDVEGLLVYSEIDPAFNAAPATFSMQNYAPKFFLINGKAFPETELINVSPGAKVLLRQVNASVNHHSVGVLGMHQSVLAMNGDQFAFPHQTVAESLAPGQSVDSLVTIPSAALLNSRFMVGDATFRLRNGTQAGLGGMMTFMIVSANALPPSGLAGPLTNSLTLAPDLTSGGGMILSGTITDVTTGGQNVVAAEYFIDSLPLTGATAITGFSSAATVTISQPISASVLNALSPGGHLVYVRGQDTDGTWGPLNSVFFMLDKQGPDTTGLAVAPNPTNGTADVMITATGNDTASGGSNVLAAEFSLNSGTPMGMTVVNPSSSLSALTGLLPQAMLQSMAEGQYELAVRAKDALDNWGLWSSITFRLDRTGPVSSNAILTPNVLDFTSAPTVTSVRVDVEVNDLTSASVQSKVDFVEGFINAFGGNGTGFPLIPTDGLFDETSEMAYFNIPLPQFAALPNGLNTLFLHGKDSAGNWGSLTSVTITILRPVTDTVGPDINGLIITPNIVRGLGSVAIDALAVDPEALANVAAVEWFLDPATPVGAGTPLLTADGLGFNTSTTEAVEGVISSAALSTGYNTIYLRALDTIGNWGPTSSIQVFVATNWLFMPSIIK